MCIKLPLINAYEVLLKYERGRLYFFSQAPPPTSTTPISPRAPLPPSPSGGIFENPPARQEQNQQHQSPVQAFSTSLPPLPPPDSAATATITAPAPTTAWPLSAADKTKSLLDNLGALYASGGSGSFTPAAATAANNSATTATAVTAMGAAGAQNNINKNSNDNVYNANDAQGMSMAMTGSYNSSRRGFAWGSENTGFDGGSAGVAAAGVGTVLGAPQWQSSGGMAGVGVAAGGNAQVEIAVCRVTYY